MKWNAKAVSLVSILKFYREIYNGNAIKTIVCLLLCTSHHIHSFMWSYFTIFFFTVYYGCIHGYIIQKSLQSYFISFFLLYCMCVKKNFFFLSSSSSKPPSLYMKSSSSCACFEIDNSFTSNPYGCDMDTIELYVLFFSCCCCCVEIRKKITVKHSG